METRRGEKKERRRRKTSSKHVDATAKLPGDILDSRKGLHDGGGSSNGQ